MQAGVGGPNAQIAMPFRFTGYHRHLHVVFGDRSLYVPHVRDAMFKREFLVPLVNPIRLIRVVGHNGEFESRVSRHCARDIVVLHHAQYRNAKLIHPLRQAHNGLPGRGVIVPTRSNARWRRSPDVPQGSRRR